MGDTRVLCRRSRRQYASLHARVESSYAGHRPAIFGALYLVGWRTALANDAASRSLNGRARGLREAFVLTAGTALVAPGRVVTERDRPVDPTAGRAATEEFVLATAERGVRASVVRLSPSVHGEGDYGFVPMPIDIARSTGVAAYVGDGANRWPAVHRLDPANLFRLAIEKAEPGRRLNGAAEEGVPMRDIAQTIGEGLGLPVRSLSPDEAQAHFGWFAGFVALDGATSSALTRETLGWELWLKRFTSAEMRSSSQGAAGSCCTRSYRRMRG